MGANYETYLSHDGFIARREGKVFRKVFSSVIDRKKREEIVGVNELVRHEKLESEKLVNDRNNRRNRNESSWRRTSTMMEHDFEFLLTKECSLRNYY